MARIAGVNIPTQKRVEIALRYIYGIGPMHAKDICTKVGVEIIEIKSVESISNVHMKQLLTYIRVTDLRLGLLINFNEALIKNGIKRVANGLY